MIILWEIFSHIGKIKDRNDQQVQKFSFFRTNQTCCSSKLLRAFRPSGYQSAFFTRKKLIDHQTMHLLPSNRNLLGQTSQKANIGRVRPKLTQFPSKQLLSVYLSSRSQWTIFLYKVIQYCNFFSLLRRFDRPKSPTVWYVYHAFLVFELFHT